MRVTLISDVPSGLARTDMEEMVIASNFLGRTGEVVEEDDTGYDTSYPTGYEPTYCLVDFGEIKIWLPYSMYYGDDKDGKRDGHPI